MANELTPVEVDLSDIQSFEPIPADIYQLAIVSVKNQRRSPKNPDNICWDLILQVVDGEFVKRKIWHTFTAGPTCAGFVAAFYNAIGLPWIKGVTLLDPTTWTGKMCFAEVIQDEYNGKINNKIKAFITRE